MIRRLLLPRVVLELIDAAARLVLLWWLYETFVELAAQALALAVFHASEPASGGTPDAGDED